MSLSGSCPRQLVVPTLQVISSPKLWYISTYVPSSQLANPACCGTSESSSLFISSSCALFVVLHPAWYTRQKWIVAAILCVQHQSGTLLLFILTGCGFSRSHLPWPQISGRWYPKALKNLAVRRKRFTATASLHITRQAFEVSCLSDRHR